MFSNCYRWPKLQIKRHCKRFVDTDNVLSIWSDITSNGMGPNQSEFSMICQSLIRISIYV